MPEIREESEKRFLLTPRAAFPSRPAKPQAGGHKKPMQLPTQAPIEEREAGGQREVLVRLEDRATESIPRPHRRHPQSRSPIGILTHVGNDRQDYIDARAKRLFARLM
jgi:hypothetical protein